MKKLSLRTLIQNLYSLWVYDYHKDTLRLSAQQKVSDIKLNIIGNQLLDGSIGNEELAYVINMMDGPCGFPYKKIKSSNAIEIGYDKSNGMHYVIHESKRLYFPRCYDIEKCRHYYRVLVEVEQITGGGYLEKAPHEYMSENFLVEQGDCVVDIGAAEGLFALHVIEKVRHAYLVESDSVWIPALQATFAPYKDKVTIINKYMGENNDEHSITLANVLLNETDSVFVKMDIEGAECAVIRGSLDYLKQRSNIKLACCTYHYAKDAEELATLFDSIQYHHEFSDGLFLYTEYDMTPPLLRHAVIRASKRPDAKNTTRK